MAFIDYYKILGVDKNIPQKDVRAAYRKRAKQFHPDLHPNDAKAKAKFQALNEAYEVISDPQKRAQYDQYGQQWKEAGGFANGAGENSGFNGAGGFGNPFANFDFSSFGSGSNNDLAATVWNKKSKVYDRGHIYFVTCSRWLCREAKRSKLLKEHAVQSIPNPIDTTIFLPQDKYEARKKLGIPTDKNVILFVSQRVTDTRKGMELFIEAIEQISKEHPAMKENTCITILGGHAEEIANKLTLPTYPLGYVADQEKIRDVYNAANVFVLPSLEDNLPNTIMEAMACGIPCVSFKVGGIPEMIDHLENGYVAKERDAADLAKGIHWVLSDADYLHLSTSAVGKVQHTYSERNVAEQYINVYYEALAYKNYKL